jgi:hypothetical protein
MYKVQRPRDSKMLLVKQVVPLQHCGTSALFSSALCCKQNIQEQVNRIKGATYWNPNGCTVKRSSIIR